MIINVALMRTVVAETLYSTDLSVVGFMFACWLVHLFAFGIMTGHTQEIQCKNVVNLDKSGPERLQGGSWRVGWFYSCCLNLTVSPETKPPSNCHHLKLCKMVFFGHWKRLCPHMGRQKYLGVGSP